MPKAKVLLVGEFIVIGKSPTPDDPTFKDKIIYHFQSEGGTWVISIAGNAVNAGWQVGKQYTLTLEIEEGDQRASHTGEKRAPGSTGSGLSTGAEGNDQG